MQVQILKKHNPEPFVIDGSNIVGIHGLLEKFLKEYLLHSEWKNQPMLLTFDPLEEKRMLEDAVYRTEHENDAGYLLRMLRTVTDLVNKSRNLVCGFSPAYQAEFLDGVSQGRKIGVVYYEPPYFTTTPDTLGRPIGFKYNMILGTIIPPST